MYQTRVHVSLVLTGDFEPKDLSEQLRLTPTSSHPKGEPLPFTGRRQTQAAWILDSEGRVEADTIEPHLIWLVDTIARQAETLQTILANGTVEGHVSCLWASPGGGGGPWLESATMGRLAALGLPLIISFYAMDDAQ